MARTRPGLHHHVAAPLTHFLVKTLLDLIRRSGFKKDAHVPLALAEKVDQIAARLERSCGWIVKQALTPWIDQEEERRRLTLEALAEIDAGRHRPPGRASLGG